MSSRLKPIAALLGLLVALCAVLFVSTQSASAYPPGVAPVISINPSDPSCGSTVTIHGTHYKPGEVVVITVNGHREATFTAGKNGTFTGSFTLVCHGTGPQTIRASGSDGDVDSITISAGSTTTHHHSGAGSLSSTGVAVVGIAAVGVVLLLGGGLLLFAGRRRRVSA